MAAHTVAGRPRRQGGFAYLLLLALVVGTGMALAAVGTLWDSAQQRVKEQELLHIGNQYRQAIGAYYQQTPGAAKRYPAALEDLLKDPRQPHPERYLRRPWRDPITQTDTWGLVMAPQGGIMGVFSTSQQQPLKRANFDAPNQVFEEVAKQRGEELRYADWQFVYLPLPLRATPLPGSTP